MSKSPADRPRSRSPPPLRIRWGCEGSEVAIPFHADRSVATICRWLEREKGLGSDKRIILVHGNGPSSSSASRLLQSEDSVPERGVQAIVTSRPQIYMARVSNTVALSRLDCCAGWQHQRVTKKLQILPFWAKKSHVPAVIRSLARDLSENVRELNDTDEFVHVRTFVMLPGQEASAQTFIDALGLDPIVKRAAVLERVASKDFDLIELIPFLFSPFFGPGRENQTRSKTDAIKNLLTQFGTTYRLSIEVMDNDPTWYYPTFVFAQQPSSSERAILGFQFTRAILGVPQDDAPDEDDEDEGLYNEDEGLYDDHPADDYCGWYSD